MGLSVIIALGALAGTSHAQVAVQYTLNNGAPGQLATPAPYPAGRADDVRRPGFNGRLWISRPIIGGVDTGYPSGRFDPGPESFGVSDDDTQQAWVRIGNTAVGLSPWETVRGSGLKNLESGRQAWLEERGYTGGVRTFVNDLYLYAPELAEADQSASAEHSAPAGDVQPRATIHTSPDQPRFKARMRVSNDRARGAEAIALLNDGTPLAISWPQSAPNGDTSLIRVIVPETAVVAAQPANIEERATPDTQVPANATTVASAAR